MKDPLQLMLIPLERRVSHEKSQHKVQQSPKTFPGPGPGKLYASELGNSPGQRGISFSSSALLHPAQWKLRLFYNRIYFPRLSALSLWEQQSKQLTVHIKIKFWVAFFLGKIRPKGNRNQNRNRVCCLDLTHWPKLAPRKWVKDTDEDIKRG